jgi:hypothetical protein
MLLLLTRKMNWGLFVIHPLPCLLLSFVVSRNLILLIVALDVAATIQLYLEGVQVGPSLVSPVTGNNGYWVASSSCGDDLLPSPVIDSMKICSRGTAALSFVNLIIGQSVTVA